MSLQAFVPGAALSDEPPGSRPLTELIAVLSSADTTHAEKWGAVLELRQRGPEATPGLLRLVRENTGDARYYAIRALGYLKDKAATDALCGILLDRSYGPRRYAAIALGQIRDPRAAHALSQALHDKPHVAWDALDALVKIDSEETRRILADYHFGATSSDLRLSITCDKSECRLGEQIRLEANLTNVSTRPVIVALGQQEQLGHLVFQRQNGAFIERTDTGLKDARLVGEPALRDLLPGENIQYVSSGKVVMWRRGEKDDHAFLPSGEPFLTLSFRWTAFHIRHPGNYRARLVFWQGPDLLERLRAQGLPDHRLMLVWQGKVVSNPVAFAVIRGPVDSPGAQEGASR